MRKILGLVLWFFLLVWVVLDRLATIHTLPDDLQSFWDEHMSELSTFAYVVLVFTATATLYLYWPLIARLFPFLDNEPEPEANLVANQQQARDTERLENLRDAVSDLTAATLQVAARPTQVSEDWTLRSVFRRNDPLDRFFSLQTMGRSCGGLTTKIHALVDALCRPVRLKLTEGQAHDGRSAADMLGSVGAGQTLLADRTYDSDALHEVLAARGAFANIRLMPNRVKYFAFDPDLYKQRNCVERFFNKLKHFRAIATRYDKRDDNFLASVQLASLRIWMRSNEVVT